MVGQADGIGRQTEGRDKTGVFTGGFATNPVTGEAIPVFVADYVLMGYGTGAIMAVPGQDQRDRDFAATFGLPIIRTVEPSAGFEGEAYTGEGPAINSANAEVSLNGLGVMAVFLMSMQFVLEEGSKDGWFEDSGILALTVVACVTETSRFCPRRSTSLPKPGSAEKPGPANGSR